MAKQYRYLTCQDPNHRNQPLGYPKGQDLYRFDGSSLVRVFLEDAKDGDHLIIMPVYQCSAGSSCFWRLEPTLLPHSQRCLRKYDPTTVSTIPSDGTFPVPNDWLGEPKVFRTPLVAGVAGTQDLLDNEVIALLGEGHEVQYLAASGEVVGRAKVVAGQLVKP